jgi:hypothetical protein
MAFIQYKLISLDRLLEVGVMLDFDLLGEKSRAPSGI